MRSCNRIVAVNSFASYCIEIPERVHCLGHSSVKIRKKGYACPASPQYSTRGMLWKHGIWSAHACKGVE